MSRVLVVAAHRDDEVLGAGGFLAQRPGAYVCWLGYWKRRAVITNGDLEALALESQQADGALQTLGALPAHQTWVGGPPDNQFDSWSLLHVTELVEQALEAIQPTVVYTHQPHDLNIDHRLTCQAVLTATRPLPGQTVKAIYGFEVPSSTEWAFGHLPFAPNVFVPLSDAAFEKKLAALRCYESELREFPHPRSVEAVSALARWRGAQCGHPLAEAFMLLRELRA